MVRHATAVWNGSGKEGKGHLTTASKALDKVSYNYRMRFENDPGTNPEELVAAAHAGCFSMKLSFILGEAGFTPDSIETRSDVTLENGAITKSHLTVTASVPGISKEKFDECVQKAKETCPISKSLSGQISAEGRLQ
ncbi:MAG TPA: OsmC family protein [Flavisolibacter sp.]